MLSRYSRPAALIATLLVPLGLLHAFVLAEICIALTDVLFLTAMVQERNFGWARQPWFIAAMVWWVWLLFCSIPWPGFATAGFLLSFVQALVIIRFIIFAVALQSWVLTTPATRRTAWLMLALSALWVGVESWQQYLTGSNVFGNHRFGDGALTGPFWKPRAGDLYGHLVILALLPPLMALFARPGTFWRTTGFILAILAVVTSVLIGQRMGTIFTFIGLVTAALVIPQLRRVAAAAVAVAALVVVLTPFISPPTYSKLVGETSRNLGHYTLSPYGELETRATVMGLASPWHGWGYNGFRAFCPEDRFSGGLPLLHIAPTQLALGACNQHPHNFYLQAFADAGFPGLFFFVVMNLFLLHKLGAGLWKNPDPVRVGLFIGLLTFAWPFAKTDAFPTLYEPGWMFFILGLGLAVASALQHRAVSKPVDSPVNISSLG